MYVCREWDMFPAKIVGSSMFDNVRALDYSRGAVHAAG